MFAVGRFWFYEANIIFLNACLHFFLVKISKFPLKKNSMKTRGGLGGAEPPINEGLRAGSNGKGGAPLRHALAGVAVGMCST